MARLASSTKRERFHGRPDTFGREPLFVVADSLGKILNRDLMAAGIDKADERGRAINVHALRHTFGTLLSKGGVSPRTAQAAMRHSSIDLTMNVYTDPKLLDVQGALDSLPSLKGQLSPSTERAVLRATGTDGQDTSANPRHPEFAVATGKSFVAPDVSERGQSVSFPVLSAFADQDRVTSRVTPAKLVKHNKTASPAVFAGPKTKCSREGSNLQPSASEADALSN